MGANIWKYIEIGARISVIECLIGIISPIFIFQSETLSDFFITNALAQTALFVPVVIIPALVTNRMSYVDIGWPFGLVLLSFKAQAHGTGFWLRKWTIGLLLFWHGGRMAFGGLYNFYPYKFKEDLTRYRYAKLRWVSQGMPESHWPFKIQHDLIQQLFANIAFLPVPIALTAYNTTGQIHLLEIIGLLMYLLSTIWENKADFQKMKFIKNCIRAAKKEGVTPEQKQQIKSSVLGYEPWNGHEYSCWTVCRHPNYFGEWVCWVSFIVISIPSLLDQQEKEPFYIKFTFGMLLQFTARFFYDCLNFWTGAEPAEYFSCLRRPNYKKYQAKTRVFWPINIPFIDHCMESGWPHLRQD